MSVDERIGVGDPDSAAFAAMVGRAARDATAGSAQVVAITGARGSGKSHALRLACRVASGHAIVPWYTRGCSAELRRPFGAVAALLADVPEPSGVLGGLVEGVVDVDPATVTVHLVRELRRWARGQPLCLAIDDVDRLDTESRVVLDAVLAGLVGHPHLPVVAVTSSRTLPDRQVTESYALPPLPEHRLFSELVRRGVAPGPATACARTASGLPGLAVALAAGLTDEQRRGAASLPAVLVVSPELLGDSTDVLTELAAEVRRALVVVAADDAGDIRLMRRALDHLHLDADVIEVAEARGVVDIDGPSVRFRDPWTRQAAYLSVGPAERRAAHRALSIANLAPHEATARAHHAAAAATGRCDQIARMLARSVAVPRRPSASSPVWLVLDRAIDLAASPDVRERLQLEALAAALDSLDLDRARSLASTIEPRSADAAVAVVEALELCGATVPTAVGEAGEGPWARRRRRRLATEDAARGGRHVDSPDAADAHGVTPGLLLSRSQWLRHAGRLAESRRALAIAERMLTPSCVAWAAAIDVAHADLDQLEGRFDECDRRLAAARGPLDEHAAVASEHVAARRAAADPDRPPPWALRISVDVATHPLATFRMQLGRAIRLRDARTLDALAADAEAHGWPIEAGEATLAALEVSAALGRPVETVEHVELVDRFWHLGVHAWDGRLAAIQRMVDGSRRHDVSCLSLAERRVADSVAAGLTNREAARHLYLSVKTVDFHLQRIYRKLGLRSRSELAVVMATQRAEPWLFGSR